MTPHVRRVTRELLFDSGGFGVVSGPVPCVRRIDPRPARRAQIESVGRAGDEV